MDKGETIHPWYALQVRTRRESSVAEVLRGKGYELFLPQYKSKRRWSDRTKIHELALFPGYLFCRFNVMNRLPILTTPGVLTIVGIGRTPIPVENDEIDAVRMIVHSGLSSQPWPWLKVGQSVRIEQGPLSGIDGILLNLKGQSRVVVSVTLLQRSVAVEVDSCWVSSLAKEHVPLAFHSKRETSARQVTAA